MAASGAPMPTLAAIIAVIMEVPAAILIVLGFFTRPLAVIFIFYTLGTAVIGHHLLGYDWRCGIAEHD
ncbi:inner membrane protein YphA [Klebsiella pneumoniae]|nr:inner membrane protein YphA [Klebsiella pneumoniae]